LIIEEFSVIKRFGYEALRRLGQPAAQGAPPQQNQ
jgi:hypothetical protein